MKGIGWSQKLESSNFEIALLFLGLVEQRFRFGWFGFDLQGEFG